MSAGLTLAIDASTYTGSVVVVRGGTIVSARVAAMRGEKEERLMPAVAAALADAASDAGSVTRVVCGAGPGSFTSLRIAGSIAKGIALAQRCPLYAVSSLALMIAASERTTAGRYLAVLDAMRGEAYASVVDVGDDGQVAAVGAVRVLALGDVAPLAEEQGAIVAGPGHVLDVAPHARGVARMLDAIERSAPVDLASWEPSYGRLAEAQVKWEAAHGRALSGA